MPESKTSFFDREPQVVQGFVTWALVQVGALILGHTDLVTSDQWSAWSSALVPIVSAVVIGVVTLVWRRWLSPAWKVIEGDINKTPYGPAVEALVEAKLKEYLDAHFPAQGEQPVAPRGVNRPQPGAY